MHSYLLVTPTRLFVGDAMESRLDYSGKDDDDSNEDVDGEDDDDEDEEEKGYYDQFDMDLSAL